MLIMGRAHDLVFKLNLLYFLAVATSSGSHVSICNRRLTACFRVGFVAEKRHQLDYLNTGRLHVVLVF